MNRLYSSLVLWKYFDFVRFFEFVHNITLNFCVIVSYHVCANKSIHALKVKVQLVSKSQFNLLMFGNFLAQKRRSTFIYSFYLCKKFLTLFFFWLKTRVSISYITIHYLIKLVYIIPCEKFKIFLN